MINILEIYNCKMKREEDVMKKKIGCNQNKKLFKDSKLKWNLKEKRRQERDYL